MDGKKTGFSTLKTLFIIFFKAGTFTFAGGLAMLPVIENDIVIKHKMMSCEDFLEYATLSQTLPGIIALNCACFVGRRTAGFAGMIAAGFGAIVSAFVLMLVATIALQYVPTSGPAAGAMRGIRAASAAQILSAAYSLGRNNLKTPFAVAVAVVSFVAVFILNISTPLVVAAACLIGCVYILRFKRGGSSA